MGFDDPSIPHAHQVDAAHGAGAIRPPDHPPPDLAAIAARNDAFGLKMYALRGGDLRPERDAGILALKARAIGRRLGVFEDAVVSDQVPQRRGIVTEEDMVETLQDRFGPGALGVIETATAHGRLRCWFHLCTIPHIIHISGSGTRVQRSAAVFSNPG